MNFGHKILIAIILFIVLIGTMVAISMSQKDIFLVSESYYQDELDYQNEINNRENLKKLSAPINISHNSDELKITFPEEMLGATGMIKFFRPADAKLDFIVPLDLKDVTTQVLDISKVRQGSWILKLTWSKNGTNFQQEKNIII